MKSFPEANLRNISKVRKQCERKQVSAKIHQLAHDLFNQLSVINLCSFKLHVAVRDLVGPAASDNLQALDRSVEDAMRVAERLFHIVESASHLDPKPTVNQVTASS
jgi:hypothetical protein